MLNSTMVQDQFVEKTNQLAQPKLALKRIMDAIIPLPPLAEQARIVARVETLLAHCDALEAAQAARAEKRALFAAAAWSAVGNSDYEAWHSVRDHFPLVTATPADVKLLREAILQLAVRGKLVAQDPTDEPADLLLERIAAEKARLVAAGEMKAGKPLPPISEEEMPYDLPPGWVFASLETVASIERGVTFPASAKYQSPIEDGIVCLRTSNVQEKVDWYDLIYIPETYVKGENKLIEINDILISMANSRELVGKTCIVEHVPHRATFGGFISVIRTTDVILPNYFLCVLRSNDAREWMKDVASQTTNIANISVGKLNTLIIPLPPLAEQARIVARVESLLAQCDALETALAAREQTQAALAGAMTAGNGNLTPLPPSP